MTIEVGGDLQGLLHRAEQGAWQLAAVALTRRGGAEPLVAAAQQVLRTLDLTAPGLASFSAPPDALAAQAAAPLLQTAMVVSGGEASWEYQSDEALLAQGRASAQSAAAFVHFVLPHLGDLRSRLEEPGSRILDVGTGVAAMAVAYAEIFSAVHVVGLDVSERALGLAKATASNSPAGSRVELRRQSVADLTDDSAYDLAWLPAPFIPETALRQGIARIAVALRPGGWVMLGHGKYGSDPVDDAVNRFKTVAFGGTPLADAEAETLLTEAGLSNVLHMPTPPGAPAIALAQRL